MKVSKHFDLREFIDPDIWAILGEKSIILIDHRIIEIADFFRGYFDVPIVINNWHSGGPYKESGLRKFLTKTGAKFSQHKFGRAIDMKLEHLHPEAVRKEVLAAWRKFRRCGMSAMEAGTPTWVHVDCRYTGTDDLLIIQP